MWKGTPVKIGLSATISKNCISSKRFLCIDIINTKETEDKELKEITQDVSLGGTVSSRAVLLTYAGLTKETIDSVMENMPIEENEFRNYISKYYNLDKYFLEAVALAVEIHENPKKPEECWHIHVALMTKERTNWKNGSSNWRPFNKKVWNDEEKQFVDVTPYVDIKTIGGPRPSNSAVRTQFYNVAGGYVCKSYFSAIKNEEKEVCIGKLTNNEDVVVDTKWGYRYFNVTPRLFEKFDINSKKKSYESVKRRYFKKYLNIADEQGPEEAMRWLMKEDPVYEAMYGGKWFELAKEQIWRRDMISGKPVGLFSWFDEDDFHYVPELEYWQKSQMDKINFRSTSLIIIGEPSSGKTALGANMCKPFAEKNQVIFDTSTKGITKAIPGWTKGFFFDDLISRGTSKNDEPVKSEEALNLFNTLTESNIRYVGGSADRKAFMFQIFTFNPERAAFWHLNDPAIARRTFIVWYMHPGLAYSVAKEYKALRELMYVPTGIQYSKKNSLYFWEKHYQMEVANAYKLKIEKNKSWTQECFEAAGAPVGEALIDPYKKLVSETINLLRVGQTRFREKWQGSNNHKRYPEGLAGKAVIVVSEKAYKAEKEQNLIKKEKEFREWTGLTTPLGWKDFENRDEYWEDVVKKEERGIQHSLWDDNLGNIYWNSFVKEAEVIEKVVEQKGVDHLKSVLSNEKNGKADLLTDWAFDYENNTDKLEEDPDRWAFLGNGEFETHNYTDSENESEDEKEKTD